MTIVGAADRIVKSIFETYLQLLDKPLHGSLRFLYATLGSLSLFFSATLIRKIEFDSKILAVVPYGEQAILVVPSVFFGVLISSAKTKHGPVRLYISGVLLPAFTITVIRATWSIDVGNAAGSMGLQ